jgi:hypothetical protein
MRHRRGFERDDSSHRQHGAEARECRNLGDEPHDRPLAEAMALDEDTGDKECGGQQQRGGQQCQHAGDLVHQGRIPQSTQSVVLIKRRLHHRVDLHQGAVRARS